MFCEASNVADHRANLKKEREWVEAWEAFEMQIGIFENTVILRIPALYLPQKMGFITSAIEGLLIKGIQVWNKHH